MLCLNLDTSVSVYASAVSFEYPNSRKNGDRNILLIFLLCWISTVRNVDFQNINKKHMYNLHFYIAVFTTTSSAPAASLADCDQWGQWASNVPHCYECTRFRVLRVHWILIELTVRTHLWSQNNKSKYGSRHWETAQVSLKYTPARKWP